MRVLKTRRVGKEVRVLGNKEGRTKVSECGPKIRVNGNKRQE